MCKPPFKYGKLSKLKSSFTCAMRLLLLQLLMHTSNIFIQCECYFNSTDLKYVDSINVKLERQDKNLVCSMIMMSETATLKNSRNIEMIPCHYCDQQECQDVISIKQIFHCDLKHEHVQCEYDSIA